MTVILLEKVSPALRGNLGKWMVELKSGCFVGKTNALLRDLLWERCLRNSGEGSVIQAWYCPGEQGFQFRCHNLNGREMVDYDGIYLMRILYGED